MVPNKDGHANHGHSCVKGRFAFGYATHKDRIKKPMIRETIHEPWREVSWDEAFTFAAYEFKRIQAKYGQDSIGGITSSRCTNEETYLVQKLVRAAFGNNNVDTCARVCHSPTGFGLKATLGESAGTQYFDSVMKADVIVVIGANPTDAHPVFASQMKRRLREGAKLIVLDPRADRSRAHAARRGGVSLAAAAGHERRGGQCARARDHRAKASRRRVHRGALRQRRRTSVERIHPRPAQLAGARLEGDGRRRRARARRRASVRVQAERRHLLRPRCHRAQPRLDDGHGHREPRDVHGQHRPRRRRREPAARPEQRARLVRHGLVPARAAGLSARVRSAVRALFGTAWGVEMQPTPACAFRTCSMPRSRARSRRSTSKARTSRNRIPTRST